MADDHKHYSQLSLAKKLGDYPHVGTASLVAYFIENKCTSKWLLSLHHSLDVLALKSYREMSSLKSLKGFCAFAHLILVFLLQQK